MAQDKKAKKKDKTTTDVLYGNIRRMTSTDQIRRAGLAGGETKKKKKKKKQ